MGYPNSNRIRKDPNRTRTEIQKYLHKTEIFKSENPKPEQTRTEPEWVPEGLPPLLSLSLVYSLFSFISFNEIKVNWVKNQKTCVSGLFSFPPNYELMFWDMMQILQKLCLFLDQTSSANSKHYSGFCQTQQFLC